MTITEADMKARVLALVDQEWGYVLSLFPPEDGRGPLVDEAFIRLRAAIEEMDTT